jgi:pyruvate-ferredoxin/flavodoxin oxidoreductase
MGSMNVSSARRVMDGNEAVASVAYRLNETIGIYPITPASAMGELSDEWAARGRQNVWGTVPTVVEMQSEGGAAGTVHGALQAGALATTFTASQGLLLMLPNLYKIAGELLPCVIHVAARTIATHALSIFCDHSDVMACRPTGFAMLASSSVQQAHDFACIAQAATLASRVPFLHFMDGFRTSHELVRVHELGDDDLRALIDRAAIDGLRRRALSSDRPDVRGTAQNPDVFFQAREAANRFHLACAGIVKSEMARFAQRTGRHHAPFEYSGDPQAERVIIAMGSATQTAEEAVSELVRRGERVGALRVALYRPFSVEDFLQSLPQTAKRVAVLDRTKEPGSLGEPLYLDVVAALAEGDRAASTEVFGGRYGLSSKEFTPAMVQAVFAELARPVPRRHFSLGIVDDVTFQSLDVPAEFEVPTEDLYEAIFYGLGSDGTVGASKNTAKIVSDEAGLEVQGYFVYDSKKSGAVTASHLRFGRRPFARPYLVTRANFVGCHQFELLDRLSVLERVRPCATLLLNSPHGPEGTWERIPREVQDEVRSKRLKVHVIDAYRVAAEAGLGRHINTVMQTCFFALSGILPLEQALTAAKHAIEQSYGRKGLDIVGRNLAAVDATLEQLRELAVPREGPSRPRRPPVPREAPDFVHRVTSAMIAGHGDLLPVSAFPVDGTWPTGTSRWEKRRIAAEIPAWDRDLCIQCNKCVLACPHAAIRAKVFPAAELASAPAGFPTMTWKGPDVGGDTYSLQVAPEDCTGCRLCVEVCPAKDKKNPRHRALEMTPLAPVLEVERTRYEFFLGLPEVDRRRVHLDVKGSQLLLPLFEYSGACAGCGETPYLKLLTQLFGDRALIANATGCSSIYGANLPTTPYAADASGRGPAWANSLFEDNAEFGFGIRLAVDAHTDRARSLVRTLAAQLPTQLVDALLLDQRDEAGIFAQRERVGALRTALATLDSTDARELETLSDYLVKRSVWLVGGDGWAYDIGFGGLDHVLASNRDINVLVLDSEVYSNTGGQQSKATPLGAAAKYATLGKDSAKRDLGLHAMSYGHVYVARVAFGAKDAQTVRAFVEAEAHPGPSLIIAYSHCIAHGYDLAFGARQQKLAVDSGVWPLYRFDPRRINAGEPPLSLDSVPGKARVRDYMQGEARFRVVERLDKARYERLLALAEREVGHRIELYEQLSRIKLSGATPHPSPSREEQPVLRDLPPAVASAPAE